MTRAASRKVKEALELLASLEVPKEQLNERSALTLLALGNLKPETSWKNATAPLRRITEMMDWMRVGYKVDYAPNTRETIRRQTIHQFVHHGLLVENPDQPDRPINSPHWCYRLTPVAHKLMKSFGEPSFGTFLDAFLKHPAASALRARHRDLPRETVRLPDGVSAHLSAGGQNTLIKCVIEEFVPRFIRSPLILLLGDAADRDVIAESGSLAALGIDLASRGKTPDVLVLDRHRNWLIVVEAVTSHGPIDQKRKNELTQLFSSREPGLVFVTAFPDRKTFSRFQAQIAWETEVWVAENPDHLIHYNGERFLGPYPG